jgi:phosphatidylserine decarboxylase
MSAPEDLPPGSALERAFVRAVSGPWLSRCTARLADARLPAPLLQRLLRAYVRAYRVDLADVAEPLTSFRTFNEFFVRALRPGARPVDATSGTLVAPSDSRLHAIGPLPAGGRLEQIKGRSYSVAALLASEAAAERFRTGVHATLYLSPAMYHRVHVPVDGRIVGWRYVPGRLYPVNALAVRNVEGLFAVNERVIVDVESAEFGPVAVVLVGATNVGRITLAFTDLRTNAGRPAEERRLSPPVEVRRGDELGRFNLGSTVVLLVADPRLVPAAEAGQLVSMGQALWRRG